MQTLMIKTREVVGVVAKMAAIFLLVAISVSCSAVTYHYDFEDGTLQGWVVDGTDLAPVWHIVPSRKLAHTGLWSLEYYMENINDATKIWIERSYDVPAGRRYDVNVSWKLASRDAPVGACPIIAYVDNRDLETRFQGIQVIGYSDTGGGQYVWLSKSYLRNGVLPGASSGTGQGKIWVAIGMWGTFEVTYTWYVDEVTVEITESAPEISIGQARQAADNTRVFMQAKPASTGWSDLKSPGFVIRRICVEEPDRSAGILVNHYRTFLGDPVRGNIMEVSGIMATENGERVIRDATVTWSSSQPVSPVKPLCSSNKAIGGGGFGEYVPCAAGSVGLNNSGLLVSTSGRVVEKGIGYFVIDDGSREASCGKSATKGLVVSTADCLFGITMPADDSYVCVTGISGVFPVGGLHYPIIRLRNQNDLVTVSP